MRLCDNSVWSVCDNCQTAEWSSWKRFSQYRRMNGCWFLVSLREVQNSERILRYRSFLKENINLWEDDLTSENQEWVTVTEDIFGTRTPEIVESVLAENSVEVTTWHDAKKFIKWWRCESCKILLKAVDNVIAHDA